jgi:hypothetical protein
MQALTRLLRRAAGTLIALLILFEEWGWEPLQRGLGQLARLPLVARIERRIAALPPHAALAVFLPPVLMLLPVKLLALALIARGHALLGVIVIVLAKVLGTALAARLYALTQPALMRLPWFAALHARWVGWKTVLLAQVRASWAWRTGRVVKRLARRWWARRHA